MLSPVSTALMKMRLTLVAVPALSASNPASFHPFKISCPSAQISPPTQNAFSRFFPVGDVPDSRAT